MSARALNAKSRRAGYAVSWLLCLAPLPAAGMTLEQAVRRGLEINPQVAQVEQEIGEAATNVDIARDGYWPQVGLSAGPEGFSTSNFGYDLTASQTLYDWGRVRSQVDGASAGLRQVEQERALVTEEAALDIVEVYLDVIGARERQAAVARHIEALERVAELARSRSEVGYTDRSESERAALELARAREQAALEAGALNDAVRQFRQLVGESPDQVTLPEPLALTDLLSESPAMLDSAVVSAPQFRQNEERMAEARAGSEEARAALMPRVNLEGSALRREIGGTMEDDIVVALRLRMEPFQGLSNVRRTTSADQRLEAARWGVEVARRDVERTVTSLIEHHEALTWRRQALEAQLDSAQRVAEAYDEQFSVGYRDVFELLNLQRDAFEAERQLVELATEQRRLQYRAAAQLGLLSPMMTHTEREMAHLLRTRHAAP
ncbi:TolC family protein [Halomonas sp. PAMB 3264]|uniref:TolC family protein n=1 Tax=Halomonas sp. PAMB 3264 TaxID=3075222 RepID=UPI0028998DCF|nr:TolC family protein [Halomonas sp. PAMB 3264]WNL43535.1 TolC family protein [Halomonas sp. PAMB 3264]